MMVENESEQLCQDFDGSENCMLQQRKYERNKQVENQTTLSFELFTQERHPITDTESIVGLNVTQELTSHI